MKVFLIAGEPSGDKLGAALMAGLKTLQPEVEFHGIGGPLMEAEGLQSQFPMEELSIMGIWEVLPKYRALKARIRETADQIARLQPAAPDDFGRPLTLLARSLDFVDPLDGRPRQFDSALRLATRVRIS